MVSDEVSLSFARYVHRESEEFSYPSRLHSSNVVPVNIVEIESSCQCLDKKRNHLRLQKLCRQKRQKVSRCLLIFTTGIAVQIRNPNI